MPKKPLSTRRGTPGVGAEGAGYWRVQLIFVVVVLVLALLQLPNNAHNNGATSRYGQSALRNFRNSDPSTMETTIVLRDTDPAATKTTIVLRDAESLPIVAYLDDSKDSKPQHWWEHFGENTHHRTVEPMGELPKWWEPYPFSKRFEKELFGNKTEECKPVVDDWKTAHYPTCNLIHEFEVAHFKNRRLGSGYSKVGYSVEMGPIGGRSNNATEEIVFRTMLVNPKSGSRERVETPLTMEAGRLESLVMERLTSSPRIIDQYAYCAQAFVTEIGKETVQDRFYDWRNKATYTNEERLATAAEVAASLSDLHSIDVPKGKRPSMTHNDFGGSNILITADNGVKLYDFGEGIPLEYSDKDGEQCDFEITLVPQTLSEYSKPPERFCDLSTHPECEPGERRTYGTFNVLKYDIFSLGTVLSEMLTGVRCPMKFEFLEERRKFLPEPRTLPLPDEIYESNETAVLALKYAALACLTSPPEDRPTAYRVSEGLRTASKWIRDGRTTSTPEEIKPLFQDDGKKFAGVARQVRTKENTGG